MKILLQTFTILAKRTDLTIMKNKSDREWKESKYEENIINASLLKTSQFPNLRFKTEDEHTFCFQCQ